MHRLNLLVIAPFSPPTNSPEAIQVGRVMAQLDQHACGVMVSAMPAFRGWARPDASLALPLQHFISHPLSLPLHRMTSRILGSHRMARFHRPDAMMWMRWRMGSVLRRLTQKPDIIYSRSGPLSGALLALKLKKKLGVPWVMHLSDPWADSPYRTWCASDAADEAECFTVADGIALTTMGQADFYRKKYPEYAEKIFVSPNVMPDLGSVTGAVAVRDGRLHIVFTGNLYGRRSPKPLMDALAMMRATLPHLLEKLRVDVYGNAQEPALSLLRSMPEVVHCHGAVPFAEAFAAQKAADVVLSIEPEMDSPFSLAFLPSKVLDCLALRKPLLAITPEASETSMICGEGYGWAVSPERPEEIAVRIAALIAMVPQLRGAQAKDPPQRYEARVVVNDLLMLMRRLQTNRGI